MRTFTGLADEPDTPPAPSLAESVRAVRRDHGGGRWQLHLSRKHVESVAYAPWLHALTGSASETNRYAREYGVSYRP